MLKIHVPAKEWFDEKNNEFISFDGADLELEHSLLAISEWESKWNKPFLSNEKKTKVEFIDYIRCMTVNKVDKLTYLSLTSKNVEAVSKYLEEKRTATWFSKKKNTPKHGGEAITSELVYYWMVETGIPFSCDKWNFNRLMTLIEVCNRKNAPQKKRSPNDILAEQARLNAERRKRLNTKG